MTEGAATAFDMRELRRCFEEWDIPALQELYADDVEHTSIDDQTPPASPGRRGKAELLELLRYCARNGVAATVENPVIGGCRVACTLTRTMPGGRRVISNAIFELRDGRIVRQLDIQARNQT